MEGEGGIVRVRCLGCGMPIVSGVLLLTGSTKFQRVGRRPGFRLAARSGGSVGSLLTLMIGRVEGLSCIGETLLGRLVDCRGFI